METRENDNNHEYCALTKNYNQRNLDLLPFLNKEHHYSNNKVLQPAE